MIKSFYVWVAIDKDGKEILVAVKDDTTQAMNILSFPCEGTAMKFEGIVKQLCDGQNVHGQLVRFDSRRIIKTISPGVNEKAMPSP